MLNARAFLYTVDTGYLILPHHKLNMKPSVLPIIYHILYIIMRWLKHSVSEASPVRTQCVNVPK